jgi:hypothetical protein
MSGFETGNAATMVILMRCECQRCCNVQVSNDATSLIPHVPRPLVSNSRTEAGFASGRSLLMPGGFADTSIVEFAPSVLLSK